MQIKIGKKINQSNFNAKLQVKRALSRLDPEDQLRVVDKLHGVAREWRSPRLAFLVFWRVSKHLREGTPTMTGTSWALAMDAEVHRVQSLWLGLLGDREPGDATPDDESILANFAEAILYMGV
jgi:hypothetical protein